MATDLKWIQKKIDGFRNRGKDSAMLKLPIGDTIVRIVPYAANPERPFIEIYVNHTFSRSGHFSPFTFGARPDPVMEFCAQLRAEGNNELAKRIEPKHKWVMPVVTRNKATGDIGDDGVKFLVISPTLMNQIMDLFPIKGDIVDPETGTDLLIKKTGLKGDINSIRYAVIPLEAKPITTDPEKLQSVLTEQPKLEDLYPCPTYSEMKDMLEDWLAANTGKSATVEATSRPASSDVLARVNDGVSLPDLEDIRPPKSGSKKEPSHKQRIDDILKDLG